MDTLKIGRLNLRLSEKRVAKLKADSTYKDKTVTQLIEDWIDRLPLLEGLETGGTSGFPKRHPTLDVTGTRCARYDPLVLKVGTSAIR